MRKQGLLFLLILFVIIFVVFYLLTDRWLEHQMESVGNAIVGAKVEFDGVDFSLFNLSMHWDSLKVTDPKNTWHNLFETGTANFDMEFEPLLSKKFVIDNLQLEGLRFNTRRKTDGKLPHPVEKESKVVALVKKELEKESDQMPVFNLQKYTKKINLDSLWKMVNLQTPKKIDSLKQAYLTTYQNWDDRLNNLSYQNELSKLQTQISAIQVDQVKSVEELQSTLQKANNIYKQADTLTKEFKGLKTEFQSDLKNIQETKKIVPNWISQDYRRALNMAQIPNITVGNIAKLLFGQAIISRIDQVTGYVGTARYYAEKLKSDKPEKENPPRLKGQDIRFGAVQDIPKFWIKKVSLSGQVMNEVKISGAINNIVSRQKIIDQPTTVSISGERRDKAALNLSASFDYRGEKPEENIELQMQQIPLSNVKLTNFALLPNRLNKGSGNIKALMNFQGGNFKTDIQFIANQLSFDLSEDTGKLDKRLVEFSRSLASSITDLNISAVAKEVEGKFSFSLNSNLDNLIANKVKGIVSDEVDKARNQIEQRVRQEVEKYQAELNNFVDQKNGALTEKIQNIEAKIEEQKKAIEAKRKEIQDQVEAEKKKLQKKLEDEAKNKLKNLFK